MELKQYFLMIWKKSWLIAVVVIIACTLTYIKSHYYTTPIYRADAKLIVNQRMVDKENLNLSSIQMNLMLINSYKEIIKSAAIMNKVVEKYPDIKVSPRALAARISVSSANQSQVMNLTYVDTSFDRASKTVNAISTVFKDEITSIMQVDNVTILSESTPEDFSGPINVSSTMDMLISFMVSFMLSVGLIFLIDYLDHTFKSETEVKETLDLPILAIVTKIKKKDMRLRKTRASSKKQKVGEETYATINS
ncbi:Wzz/FepE/Etk N-terminal domain-containing protein [Paenibacillus sacheonensis]|uniref:Lipopolysaccharide biosynthesis protein n=1 Tax=Paenibacillus sacheonensis TaxID=742054 RepID=A0A7X4YP09_9BACL|nr:capsular polysaccharide biosynthesis protein [Paenibacillus sacheonensis]NBC69905.1 lipopolysaccharide biosynthesis protein [Paenibacillus sacheonensis]